MTVNFKLDQQSIELSAADLQYYSHGLAVACGWWTDVKTGADLRGLDADGLTGRNVGELIALVHSELSEALEAFRKNKMDDHLPDRRGIEVELGDAVIRIFDLAGGLRLDLGGAIAEKLEFNKHRQDHTLAHRAGDDGKKF
jgi:NTP pyrophosphatase (non-canonical NTP hydrolase)